MKKFLALVLALIMTMSLVTISAGAEDFADADSITYEEAVDVMTAIGVVGGYADGSFNPTAGLTRGAAAKIICNMLLGPTTAEALVANEAPFSDVAVDNVFAGYIAYCVNEGIISGYADGTFKPAAPLTGYAFMKMLLGALGYDAINENYVGSNWSIQVAKRALNIGLDAGLVGDFSGAKALTREEACLYAFNTLKADMVEYKNDSKITVGDIVVSNSSKAEVITKASETAATDYARTAGASSIGEVQFCEQYFSKLIKGSATEDIFGRPATAWVYKTKAVGTYANDAVAVVNGKVKASEVATLLDGYKLKVNGAWQKVNNVNNYAANDVVTVDVWYNGTASGTKTVCDYASLTVDATETLAKFLADYSAQGRTLEVYADDDNQITDVVMMSYGVGEVTKVVTDKKTGDVTYDVAGKQNLKDYADADLNDSIVMDSELAKGDIVTYVVSRDGDVHVFATENVQGALSAVNTTAGSVKVDGVDYIIGAGVEGATAINTYATAIDTTAVNFYLDQFGYVVYSDAIANANYAFIVGTYAKENTTVDGTTPYAQVKAVLADGTVGTYDLKLTKTTVNNSSTYSAAGVTVYPVNQNTTIASVVNSAFAGKVFTYTIADGVITLGQIADFTATTEGTYDTALAANQSFTNKATATSVVYGNTSATALLNNETVFVFYNSDKGTVTSKTGNTSIDGYTVATADTNAIVLSTDANGVATVEYVFVTDATSTTTNVEEYIYIDSAKYVKTNDGKNDYYTYTATKLDGTTVDVKAKDNALTYTGVYTYENDNSIADTNGVYVLNSTWGVANTYTRGAIFAQGTAKVAGSLVSVDNGSTYFNVVDATATAFVDTTKYDVDGNSIIVIREWSNAQATANVAGIFVIG